MRLGADLHDGNRGCFNALWGLYVCKFTGYVYFSRNGGTPVKMHLRAILFLRLERDPQEMHYNAFPALGSGSRYWAISLQITALAKTTPLKMDAGAL